MGKAECKVCAHPQRDAIDVQLMRSVPYRVLAGKFKVSMMSLSRHKAGGHTSSALVALSETSAEGELSNVQRVESLIAQVEAVLQSAKQSGKTTLTLAAVKELRVLNEQLRRVKLDEPVALDLRRNPQWTELRTIMLHAFDQEGWEFAGKARRCLAEAISVADTVGPGGHVSPEPSSEGDPTNGTAGETPVAAAVGPLPL
jgi:hypothetical protein